MLDTASVEATSKFFAAFAIGFSSWLDVKPSTRRDGCFRIGATTDRGQLTLVSDILGANPSLFGVIGRLGSCGGGRLGRPASRRRAALDTRRYPKHQIQKTSPQGRLKTPTSNLQTSKP